jgi:hypothetical protein
MCKHLICAPVAIAMLCLLSTIKTYSQDKDIPKDTYLAAGIPDSLKEDANSIVRYSSDEVTIKGPGAAVVKHHKIITILNEKGDRDGIVEFGYNRKYDSYSSILIQVYNADGALIKKYHKSDMYDGAAIDNETMVSDERFLGLKHTIANYPTTIEVSYEENLGSFISIRDWDIQDMEQAVQHETYKVLAKPEIGFRYKYKNIALNPIKVTTDGWDTYVWQVSNIKAIKKEEGSEAWSILPYVAFGTNSFNCDGYPGEINSWQNYGKWVYGLNKDVCTLSPERANEIRKMTDTIRTNKAKAKFLYEYLQQNTRYVSIQLGIGGWKPFDAKFVDNKKYGDCKALANYMYALLKAVGIPSYWAVIGAGYNEEPSDPAFPVNNFNHEILCIPFSSDTTWIDCTSTTQPFGKLGPFTENRNALIITEDGGKLINTPKSTAQDNQFNSEVHLAIDSDGGAKAQVKILCTGVYRSEYVDHLPYLKADEQKEEVMHMLNIKQPSAFEYDPGADKNGTKEVDLSMEYDKFCDIMAGDKEFYHPHVFDLCAFTIPTEEKRKSAYYFETPMQKSCVTTIGLPKGFVIETLPVNQTLKFTYGSYDVKYVYDAAKNQVISTAKFTITNQVIPAAKYTELQQYLDAVARAQNKKLVIRHKA